MISVVLCKVSQPSREEPKSYDGKFVTAKCSSINYGATLKLSKTVDTFSKLRYYVDVDILIMLYYSLIYPFRTYGIQVWGLTYPITKTSNYFAKTSRQNNDFFRP